MAVKEAEENDIMDDDDDDNVDADAVRNGTTDKKSLSLAESATGGRSQHKCGRKPTVCFIYLFIGCIQSGKTQNTGQKHTRTIKNLKVNVVESMKMTSKYLCFVD